MEMIPVPGLVNQRKINSVPLFLGPVELRTSVSILKRNIARLRVELHSVKIVRNDTRFVKEYFIYRA
eukprot:1392002-Amorphochlora_amoeboformis.AAC.2